MTLAAFLGWLVSWAAPWCAGALLLSRSRSRDGRLAAALGASALGAAAFVPAFFLPRAIARWTGLESDASGSSQAALLVFELLVAAPIHEGFKVAAVVPVTRSRPVREGADGLVHAAAAAVGFATVHNAAHLWGRPLSAVDIARTTLSLVAHAMFAAAWGWALGRAPRRRIGARGFEAAWLGAALLGGLYDHLVFRRGPGALAAAQAILLGGAVLAAVAARRASRRASGAARPDAAVARHLPRMAPPSIGAIRAALRRTERPLMIGWIALGALVTTGVMTSALAGSVLLGHRIGIDFAAAERADGTPAAIAPLVLLGTAALAAFPVAGYLIARASEARSVLEPAMSAALAIAGSLVLLGLAAPVAVVFAIAFAPIAFALACAGAWMGLGR